MGFISYYYDNFKYLTSIKTVRGINMRKMILILVLFLLIVGCKKQTIDGSGLSSSEISKLDIDDAKNHGNLDKIASTYFYKEDRLYSGVYEDGALVIDFGPIIIDDYIPLAKAIKLLLKIGEISLGYPVEIEFAVNFSKIKVTICPRTRLPDGGQVYADCH